MRSTRRSKPAATRWCSSPTATSTRPIISQGLRTRAEAGARGKTGSKLVRNVLPEGVRAVFVTQPGPAGLGHAVLLRQARRRRQKPSRYCFRTTSSGTAAMARWKPITDHAEASGAAVVADAGRAAARRYPVTASPRFRTSKPKRAHPGNRRKPRPEEARARSRWWAGTSFRRRSSGSSNTGAGNGGEIQFTECDRRAGRQGEVRCLPASTAAAELRTHIG